MKLSSNWLNSHLATNYDAALIAEKLAAIGLEVEEQRNLSTPFAKLIIAQITAITPHPAASRLNLCTVDSGSGESRQIVCGASNVRAGAKVILAEIGAIMPGNGMLIQPAVIRGIESTGMLCSAAELGISDHPHFNHDNHDGIIILPDDAPLGRPFATYAQFDDTLLDISLTPNRRRDCASVIGIARDLAAAIDLNLASCSDIATSLPPLNRSSQVQLGHIPIHTSSFNTTVTPELVAPDCGVIWYSLTMIDRANLQPSADISAATAPLATLEQRLYLIGALNQHHLVNISNYIMYDRGYPNHIYDRDKLVGQPQVRLSQPNESFIAIGGKEYQLPGGLTVIADQEKILALAGVIGGELSKVGPETRNIALEFAIFDPQTVTDNGRAIDLFSESRMRFAAGIDHDPRSIETAIGAAVSLINAASPGIVIVEHCQNRAAAAPSAATVSFTYGEIRQILGLNSLSDQTIDTILHKLGLHKLTVDAITPLSPPAACSTDAATLPHHHNTDTTTTWATFRIPSWRRGDILNSADIAEEIMRIYGLDNIPAIPLDPVAAKIQPQLENFPYESQKQARIILQSRGYHESLNYSMYSQTDITNCDLDCTAHITIANPVSNQMKHMRTTLLPGLLRNVEKNAARGHKDLALYEIGNLYNHRHCRLANLPVDAAAADYAATAAALTAPPVPPASPDNTFESLIEQRESIALVRTGQAESAIHHNKRDWDFYDLRDEFMALLGVYGLSTNHHHYIIERRNCPAYYHPGRSAAISLLLPQPPSHQATRPALALTLGYVGEIHPRVRRRYDIATTVVAAELYTAAAASAAGLLFNHAATDASLQQPAAAVVASPPTARRTGPLRLNNYQIVERDLSFFIAPEQEIGEIMKLLSRLTEPCLIEYKVFDVHQHYTVAAADNIACSGNISHSANNSDTSNINSTDDSSSINTASTTNANNIDPSSGDSGSKTTASGASPSFPDQTYNSKSIGLRLYLQAPDKTLANDEINEIVARVITLITREGGAQFRLPGGAARVTEV